tara:strand:- start:130 stop:759 length:630 start_codon:yes stop_codon:yes gene_type:complete
MSGKRSNGAFKSRRRLLPEERVSEILDAAAALVIENGVSNLNMAKIAQQAGTSKGLIYAYFPNVKTLLQEVLLREHRELHTEQLDAIKGATDFESMARSTAHTNSVRRNERGLLVERLRGDPEVAVVMQDIDRRTREGVIRYLTKQISTHFNVPKRIAEMATQLVIGPGHEHQKLSPRRLEEMDDVWSVMMVGAMKELEQRYGSSEKRE